MALLLGGGTHQGLWSDALVQLFCLPLLGLALGSFWRGGLPAGSKWALALVVAAALLPLLQLVPLPPSIWVALPGRAPIAAAFQLAGMPLPWEPVSLNPEATWFSFLSLIPAISVFLAVLVLGLETRRILSLIILGFAVASVLLGLAQLAGGQTSPLRFYVPTNPTDAVGFFANRNHYAALLTVGIPIAAAWSVGIMRQKNSNRLAGLVLLPLTYVVLLLGLGVAHSRGGLILAFVAGLVSTALAWGSKRGGTARGSRMKLMLLFLGANLCGLILAFQFGFVALANRLEGESILADLRWPIAATTVKAIEANLPWGVGFGAFEPVYQMFEPMSATLPAYVNHAHDDWLEIVLDGGLPALALIITFLLWYVWASIRIWREPPRDGNSVDRALARAGPIVVGLLLLHSTLDYPLRTTAVMVVFAFAAGLMISPSNRSQGANNLPGPRGHSRERGPALDFERASRSGDGRTRLPSAYRTSYAKIMLHVHVRGSDIA